MEHALKHRDVTAAWAGGLDGLEVINKFIKVAPKLLSKPHGVLYLLMIDVNRVDETIKRLIEESGNQMKAELIMKREVLAER